MARHLVLGLGLSFIIITLVLLVGYFTTEETISETISNEPQYNSVIYSKPLPKDVCYKVVKHNRFRDTGITVVVDCNID